MAGTFKRNCRAKCNAAKNLACRRNVVDTGPYAVVRHPLYATAFFLCAGIPLALGSFWSLVPAALSAVVIVVRTALEDRTLHNYMILGNCMILDPKGCVLAYPISFIVVNIAAYYKKGSGGSPMAHYVDHFRELIARVHDGSKTPLGNW